MIIMQKKTIPRTIIMEIEYIYTKHRSTRAIPITKKAIPVDIPGAGVAKEGATAANMKTVSRTLYV